MATAWGRRQREGQKSKENNNFTRVSRIFVHFFAVADCTTTTWICLISRFMEDVNKRRRIFLSWLLSVPNKSTPGKRRLATFDMPIQILSQSSPLYPSLLFLTNLDARHIGYHRLYFLFSLWSLFYDTMFIYLEIVNESKIIKNLGVAVKEKKRKTKQY